MSVWTSGKWKSVRVKQQCNVALAVSSIVDCANGEKFCLSETVRVLIAAVSNALTEFECYRRQRSVASLPLRLVG